jgi:hypothetical protein
MRRSSKKCLSRRVRCLLCVFIVVMGLIAVCLTVLYVQPFRRVNSMQVLDRIAIRSGGQLLLVQRFNGRLGEPSTISVYQELQDEKWIRYYVDSEASYWWSGSFSGMEQPGSYEVLRGKQKIAQVNCDAKTIMPHDKWKQEQPAFMLDRNPIEHPLERPISLAQVALADSSDSDQP